MQGFITIEQALVHLRQGNFVILMDDEHRENEGDLVIAADYATPEAINFMAIHGRGLICLPMAPKLIDNLNLPMMTSRNRSPYGTAFTVSIEAASGVTTGISASDRAHTISVAIDPNSKPHDLITPGHVFPLAAKEQGVLVRPGQTEGSVDLMQLAGLTPAAVICEIINADGSMSREHDLLEFSKIHQIPIVKIHDLIHYRTQNESWVTLLAEASLPISDLGNFNMRLYKNNLDGTEHVALIKEVTNAKKLPLIRLHSECLTGDVFGSARCDCGEQLFKALEKINQDGGALLYLRQEGRGIGLANKLKAYVLQDQGLDTVEANQALGLPADARDYSIAYQILKHMQFQNIRLLTNNPDKINALTKFGINVAERVSVEIKSNIHNKEYLHTKKHKFGHHLNLEDKHE